MLSMRSVMVSDCISLYCQDEKGTPVVMINDEDCITVMLLLY